MKRFIWTLTIIFSGIQMMAQEPAITGTVIDQNTGEPLVGVVVKHVNSGTEVITDFDGYFSITATQNEINKLSVSYISYEETKLNHILIKDGEVTSLNIKLKRAGKTPSPQNFLAQELKEKGQS